MCAARVQTPTREPTSGDGAIAASAFSPEDQALRDELVNRLDSSSWNLSQVARDMGKARQQIQRWIKRFGI